MIVALKLGLWQTHRPRTAKTLGIVMAAALATATPSHAGGPIIAGFESCLDANEYRCVVRAGFKEFVTLPLSMGLIVDPAGGRGNFEVAQTAALVGETDLARKVFDTHPHFYDRNELGGAIIARMVFDGDFDGLLAFLKSIQSPSALGMSFSKARLGLDKAPIAAQIRARQVFVEAVKAFIEKRGVAPLLEMETAKHEGKTVQRFPLAELPEQIFHADSLIWAAGLLEQLEDPKIRESVAEFIGHPAQIALRVLNEPDGRAKLAERAQEQIADDAARAALVQAGGLREPNSYAKRYISELQFSAEQNKFINKYGQPKSIALIPDQVFGKSSRIAAEDSQALEAIFDAVPVAACRTAALLHLAHAHARRGDSERATALVDKVLANDPPHRTEDRPDCDEGGRVFALMLKALLGDTQALAQLFAELDAIHRDQGFSAYLRAFKESEFTKPFVGMEDVTTHEARKAIAGAILEFQDQYFSRNPGQRASDLLIYLKAVNDPDLWMFIAREGLRASAEASPRVAEKRRVRMLELLVVNDRLKDFWFALN